MKDVPQDFATPEKQEARALLRERFLRVLTGIADKECKINLLDKSEVTAKFGGGDVGFLKAYVKDLDSPVYKVSHALLRVNDILNVEVPKATYQKLIDSPKEQNGNNSMDHDGA